MLQYFTAGGNKTTQTSQKIIANNNLYKTFITLCKDGQRIFAHQEATKKKFIVSDLLAMSGKGGSAALEGKFKTPNGTPIPNVLITEATGKYTTHTLPNGRFKITRMQAGTYEFTFTKPGHTPLTQTIEIKPGRKKRITQVLNSEMVEKIAQVEKRKAA